MQGLTFERVLAAYMAFAALLALVLPGQFAVELYMPVNPDLVPFASWLRRTPNALPYLTSYYLILTILLPIVVVLLARYPQQAMLPPFEVPTLGRCVLATLAIAAIICMFVMLHDVTLDGSQRARGTSIFYISAISRLGLALVGPVVMGVASLVTYMAVVKLPKIWLGFLLERPA